jgi:multicomponent Na+:H+ antiporter subunit C
VNIVLFYMALGLGVFILGLHGLLVLRSKLRRVIAVNLMGAGTFLVMAALANRSSPVDPVLQALIVTGLVVAISATAFALRLISTDTLDVKEQADSDTAREDQ